jgi:hypothetical protein
MTPTEDDGPTPDLTRGEKTVTPAQNNGAANSEGMPSGIGKTNLRLEHPYGMRLTFHERERNLQIHRMLVSRPHSGNYKSPLEMNNIVHYPTYIPHK